MKTRILLSVSVILTLFFSCSNKNNLSNLIVNHAKNELKHKDSCIININNFVKFNWDSMYYFSNNLTIHDVISITNNRYTVYEEFNSAIVFYHNGLIIYHEENISNPEYIAKNELIFDYNDTLQYSIFTSNDSLFYAHKIATLKGYYYYLTPL